jgi:CIC family chloride channel protein
MRLIQKYLRTPRLRTRESFLRYIEKWVLLSTVLGLLTGIVVALFDYVTNLELWNNVSELLSREPILVIPLASAALLFSGFVLSKSSTPMGSGTDEVIDVYNNPEARMDARSFPQKMLAAVITIGLGGSAGQEGPSVYAGGVMGAWIWNRLRAVGLTDDDRRILILAGAAAGIGAIFKAPLTGIIFALEVPFKDDLAHDALIPSLVGAVSSYLTLIAIDGSEPLFRFPGIVSLSLMDITAAAILAVICGLSALAFVVVIRSLTKAMKEYAISFYYKALVGAAVISVIGIASVWLYHRPYPLGISYDLISLALTPNTLTSTLLALFVMKLIATSFTLGTTGVGGIFVPQIVMGATIGGLFGEAFFPARLDLFVAVGMASFLAAGYKTPLASVAFVAETTTGPGYLIPSLVAAAISYSVSGEASVSEYQKLRGEIDITQIAHLTAKDVMTERVIAVPAEISVLDFVEEYLFKYQYKTFPIVDKDGLLGRITISEVRKVPREKWFEVKVVDICSKDLHPAYPDSSLQHILDVMYNDGLGRIPIVDRIKPKRIIGIVSKSDIIRALEKERLGASSSKSSNK